MQAKAFNCERPGIDNGCWGSEHVEKVGKSYEKGVGPNDGAF